MLTKKYFYNKNRNNKVETALYFNINLNLLNKAKIINFNLQTSFTAKLFLVVAFLALVGAAGFFLYSYYFQPHPQIPPYRPELQVCKEDSDCAVAIRLNACCSCPEVYSKDQIKKDKNLAIYEEGKTYSRRRPLSCINVKCNLCRPMAFGAVCSNNRCQEPEKWDEFLRVCPNCFTVAALAAYRDNNYPKAIQLCELDRNEDQCFLSIAREAIYHVKDKISDALRLCREKVRENQPTCLRETAQEIAKTDIENGLKICGEILTDDGERANCFHNCFHNVAVTAKEQDIITQALTICQMISSRVEDCEDLINQYCDIYPQSSLCIQKRYQIEREVNKIWE